MKLEQIKFALLMICVTYKSDFIWSQIVAQGCTLPDHIWRAVETYQK